MHELYPMKLIQVVANTALEERLIEVAGAHEISGYTILEARGAGSAGLQTGALEGESSLLFMLAVPLDKLDAVLNDINRLMRRGHHLAVFISDTQVMRREKYFSPA